MDENWYTSSMMIHKINPSVDYNQQLKLLDTQLNEPTNQNSVTKVGKPTVIITFGD